MFIGLEMSVKTTKTQETQSMDIRKVLRKNYGVEIEIPAFYID